MTQTVIGMDGRKEGSEENNYKSFIISLDLTRGMKKKKNSEAMWQIAIVIILSLSSLLFLS